MLAHDLDLEADLGIDTVKQAEVFAEIRKTFSLPRRDDLKLRDYPTLGHVIGYVREGRPDLALSAPQPAPPAVLSAAPIASPASIAALAVPASAADADFVQSVLEIVADKTGYPTDMLALDFDLEADLGIDTVKQAEIFAVVRERFDIPRVVDLKLRDYPTLSHVVEFVRTNRRAPAAAQQQPPQRAPTAGSDKAGPFVGRLVPLPVVRPALALCKPTGCTLGIDKRIVVVGDRAGVATRVVQLLTNRRAKVLNVDDVMEAGALVKATVDWAGDAPIDGIFFLPALDLEPSFDQMTAEAFRATVERNVRPLYALCHALYASFDRPGTFFISATRLGGTFGYGSHPAEDPSGGSVSGFTKAFARERENALVKVVDFARSEPLENVAAALCDEVERDPGAIEVSYLHGYRYGVTLQQARCPAPAQNELVRLGPDDVILVTGAGGGITAAITADLAAAWNSTFYLLDLAQEPETATPNLNRFIVDREGLKRDLLGRLKLDGQRLTPVMVERELARIERDAATLHAIDGVRRSGATAHYRACDVTNLDQVTAIVQEIKQRHGKISLIVHAAGLERSRTLDVKDANEFNLVFDVKVFGMFNLLAATRGVPVDAIVSFASVAGRFGNAGQADYSAANDFLCKATSALRKLRPETRALAIDWTAWASIGMATRGSIPEIMKRAGIEMLDPKLGIPVVRQEVERRGRGEVVIAGALGTLTQPRDVDGGADPCGPVVANVEAGAQPFSLRLLRADPYEGVVLATELDPSEPFLNDHRIDGVPVMPGVMGLELFAHAALALAPGKRVTGVRDVRFAAPLKCYRDEKRAAHVTLRLLDTPHGLRAHCTLTSVRTLKGTELPAEPMHHFSATLSLEEGARATEPRELPKPKADGGSVAHDDLYRAYFHGSSFRVLDRTQVNHDGDGILGRLAQPLPALWTDSRHGLLTAPRLLELCFQTAGVIEIGSTRKLGLPARIDEVRVYDGADDAGGRVAEVRVAGKDQGLQFNATVCDDQGKVLLEVRGYHTSAMPASMDEAIWAPLRDGLSGLSL
jgi:NAD(P)-dependent dehydrogenase (short-subunit alcohol dehydrogenase family)/acyl carrier protein